MVGGRTMAGAIDVRCGIVVCLSRLPALVHSSYAFSAFASVSAPCEGGGQSEHRSSVPEKQGDLSQL